MTILPTTGDRPTWLRWRTGGVGGSDAPGVVGLSPWSSPFTVWADKLDLLPPEPETEVMAAGRWLEAAIGPWFTHETDLAVAGEQSWCTHPNIDHHRCTPDGFVVRRDPCTHGGDCPVHPSLGGLHGPGLPAEVDLRHVADILGNLHIKVTGPGRPWTVIPDHYQVEGQWDMHVTGADRAWFAVLMGRRLDIHELARDQADIDVIVDEVDQFWEGHVLTGRPPAPDASDATTRALAALHGTADVGREVEADPVTHVDAIVLHDAKARRKAAEADEKARGNAIRAYLGDATELVVDGQLIASWRPQDTTRLDTARLKADHPDLYRDYSTTTTSRVLRLHTDPKEVLRDRS